jgi:uncharacterized protein
MLRVDLRALSAGPLETMAEVSADDVALADAEVALRDAVHVSGRLMATGPGSYYWEGRLRTRVAGSCRRCLAPVETDLDQPVRLLFTEDEAADDPSAVVIPARTGELDLTATIREELILAAPEFPLCRENCRGLCPRCGVDLNESPCRCHPEADPRWAALEALRGPRPDNETR